jgi:hypothetical protein
MRSDAPRLAGNVDRTQVEQRAVLEMVWYLTATRHLADDPDPHSSVVC